MQGSRFDISRIVFIGEVELGVPKLGPPLCLKTLERIRSRAWRGQRRNLDLDGTP